MSTADLARWATAALAAAALAASARTAAAYCRTSSCDPTDMPRTSQVCTPPGPGDCGTPLFWASPCVSWSLQQNASAKVTFAQAQQIVTEAFHTWATAPCPGGGTPRLTAIETVPAVCDKHEYNQDNGNANIILFHDDVWPYEGSANTLALTTVTYALDTGEIYDADMELNSADNDFTVGDTDVEYDLLSIVTHETGHFQGMAHSKDIDATMYPIYVPMSVNLRTLDPDDIAGICAIYPPSTAACACDPTPRHGFSTKCAADQTPADVGNLSDVDVGIGGTGGSCTPATSSGDPTVTGGCCSVAPGAAPPGGGWAGAAAAIGALLLLMRGGRDRARRRG